MYFAKKKLDGITRMKYAEITNTLLLVNFKIAAITRIDRII